jgi:hypothetical protein
VTGRLTRPFRSTTCSGLAAAVAAGVYPYATGSDTGDSIRKPAAYCGIVGYKPTYGMISRYGLFPYASSLDHCGVLTRSVSDAAIVVDGMKGLDKNDMTTWDSSNIHLYESLKKDVSGKKLCYIKEICAYEMFPNMDNELKEHLDNYNISEEEYINNIMDIFKLPELYNNGDIKISIPNIKNIIRNIINCQRVKLAKFIYALGIESIGEVTAQWLADTYGEEVFNLNEDQLKNQNNPLAGPEMIKHYISGIKMLEREISDLKSVLHIEMDKSTSNGVTYLITGKLYDHNKEQVPRELIINKLNSLGYVNTSTPSKAKIAILGTDHSLKKRNELKDGIKIIWAVDRDIFKIIAEL